MVVILQLKGISGTISKRCRFLYPLTLAHNKHIKASDGCQTYVRCPPTFNKNYTSLPSNGNSNAILTGHLTPLSRLRSQKSEVRGQRLDIQGVQDYPHSVIHLYSPRSLTTEFDKQYKKQTLV